MKSKSILGLVLIVVFVIGVVKFAPLELLFQDHLSDARASISVNDIDGAIKSYKLAVMENVDDSQVRREYIDFMKEQGDLEEWLALEQTFLKAFPSVENFKSYDKSIYDLVLQVDDESARILSEGDIAGYQSKRREEQELLKLFSPALLNLKAPSDYALGYVPGPIFAQIYLNDPNDVGEEKIIKAHLLIELNIAWALLTRGDNSYFNFLKKDGNVQALVRDQYGFTGWAEPFLKVHLAEVALDASNILSEQGEASDAQDLLEGCTKSSLEYMRDLHDRYGFRESVFDSIKENNLIPDLYRECSYRLTVLHINKGEFDLADTTIAALKKNYGDICETCNSLEDRAKYSSGGLSNRFKSFAQLYYDSGASEAFDDKNWELASKLYLQEADFHERYNPDNPAWASEKLYNVAMAYWNKDHYSKAKTYLRMIQEKYPSYLPEKITEKLAQINKGKASYLFSKHFKQGQNAFDEKKYSEAIQNYQKAIDASPMDTAVPTAVFNIGQSYFLLEQYAQAITSFESLLEDFTWYNSERVKGRLADSRYQIGYMKFSAAYDGAHEAFSDDSWVVAWARYQEAETLALEIGKPGLAAESAYNAAIAMKNNKKFDRAYAILRAIQSAYPTYEPNIVREQIKDLQSSCPNQYLGC
jgi:tetratricopeptide (TPR) repeat protein